MQQICHKAVMEVPSVPHTLSAFDADLREVAGLVDEMSSLVVAAIERALGALRSPDPDIASEVAAADKAIDELQSRIEKSVVRTIALRAPMADDLRALVVAIRLGSLLERAGDHAKGIARHPERAWPSEAAAGLESLERMGGHAVSMLRDAIRAYAAADCALASSVRLRDVELNSQFGALYQVLLQRMNDNAELAAPGMQMLMIGKEIERIGDYAASISDSVQYMVTGQHFADWRDDPDLPAAA
jgi:phosphate transport system protein